ncbi:MAG: DUF192 domain-containing protein [Candidatus Micrarchaeia archaeon]
MKKKSLFLFIILIVLIPISFLLLYYLNLLPLNFYYSSASIAILNCSRCNGTSKIVYIAQSYTQQITGMMYRNSFDGAYGMLFVFNSTRQACMWMENTKIPLEQVWINSNGSISFIKNAIPYSTNITCAQGKYVLEVPYNTINSSGRVII